ncbi:zinc finger protein 90-like isoform X6 [Euwallacea similis]|uniref:zinc finger protein 90-like isoform X6 n=1 Tax=Euwallacea similis TaxID=1736056 RepID=UPI00344B3306
MDNPGEILRLCRLCLVKDQVNIPIFEEQGDIRQTFLKIRSCLPVKVSRDDKLPKKICGGCSNKLDLFYEFWSSTANSEKTLQSWLGQEEEDDKMQEITKPVEALVKEESEALEDGHAHDQSFDEATKDEAEAPPAKRARRTAAVKAQINISHDSDEDEDVDGAEPITKIEDESDDSDGEEKDPSYTEVPGTSADDQAGPSGLGKDGVEAPKRRRRGRPRKSAALDYPCLNCPKVFSNQRFANLHKHTHIDESSFKPDEEGFTCIFCSSKFVLKEDMKTHMKCHSMSCKECHEHFLNPFFLGLHMAEHDLESNVACPLCEFTCKLALALKKHICGTHFGCKLEDGDEDDIEERPLRRRLVRVKSQLYCKICSKEFMTLKQLKNHRKVHKAERLETLYTYNCLRKSYSCDTCLQEFSLEDEAKMHVDVHSYICSVCNAKFKKALLLGLHMSEHNDGGSVSCPICNNEFKAHCKSRLIRHIRQTHQKERPKTSQCEYCGNSYLSKTMLEDHIRVVHLQKEPYKCIVCGNTFTLQSSMRIHQINKHRVVDESELSSNYCTLCKMSFKKPSSLMRHLEMKRCIPTPRVERQGHFVCDLCGKEFRFYKTFNLHLREHAGDKPYKCSYCPKSFVINSKRLAHEVSHTDARPFSCETCGQSYKTWKHLRRHLVVHGTNPKATFNCSFCGKDFGTKEAQRTHMKGCDKPQNAAGVT